MDTATLFVYLLIGLGLGDYIFQNNWMAINKSKPGMSGTWPCIVQYMDILYVYYTCSSVGAY